MSEYLPVKSPKDLAGRASEPRDIDLSKRTVEPGEPGKPGETDKSDISGKLEDAGKPPG